MFKFQAWIKCSIIGHDTNRDEIKILQNYILKLSDIQDIFETYNDLQEFQNNDGSILTFIMHSMKKRNTLKVYVYLLLFIKENALKSIIK